MLTTEESIHTINVTRQIDIAAPREAVFAALLEEMGPSSVMPMEDGQARPFPMVIEPRPGGRWYRDLGAGAGHLWGHVQVIKPPTLLEVTGPLFMSYAATNHVQYRLTPDGGGTRLQLTHRAIGQIPAEHREGVAEGWDYTLARIREIAEGR